MTALAVVRASAELTERDRRQQSRAPDRALVTNMILNAGWTALFFRSHRPRVVTAECALLTVSSVDLARRAGATGGGKAAGVGLYAGLCLFATAFSGAIARRNTGR